MRLLAPYLDRIAPESDLERRRQATVLILFAGLLAGQCVIWSLGHATGGSAPLALLFALCGVGTSLIIYAPMRGLSLAIAGHLVLALALAMVCLATFYTGGLRLTNVCPFFSLVIAAIFVRGRSGRGWALAALGAAVIFQVAEWQGFPFPDVVPPEDRATDAFLTWLFAGLLIFLYAYLYDSARAVATHRAEKASAARDQFLANLSHEIRTPLHVILAFQAELEHADPERHTEIMALLRENTRQLNELLTDLLELARGESSGFILVANDFDPVTVVENVGQIVEQMCRDKNLELRVHIADDVPRWLHGDSRRFHQILMNLADNAVKYTDRGAVTLELCRNGDEPGLMCRVSDTGVGIPLEAQAKIFDKFMRIDTALDRRHRGVGLGLPIARGLAYAMGGTITVDSLTAGGATFEVRIPFPIADAPSRGEAVARVPMPVGKAHVLIVEDNALNQEVARIMLARLGVTVLTAGNGVEALEIWQAERPALILMDVQMPEMDGLAATREIRRRESAGAHTIIVATTGYATSNSTRELTDAGVDDVLVKPFTQEQLENVVAHHLSKMNESSSG